MKKILIMIAALVISTSSMAATSVLATEGLSVAQVAELTAQAEKMKEAAKSPTAIIDAADKWVNTGERFGKMMGGAAKEVGMAANEFLQTPVGMLTAGVIVFNYVGGPIIHVSMGIMFLFVGISMLIYIQRKATRLEITYSKDRTTWWGTPKIEKLERAPLYEDSAGWLVVGHIALYVLSVWVIFSW